MSNTVRRDRTGAHTSRLERAPRVRLIMLSLRTTHTLTRTAAQQPLLVRAREACGLPGDVPARADRGRATGDRAAQNVGQGHRACAGAVLARQGEAVELSRKRGYLVSCIWGRMDFNELL